MANGILDQLMSGNVPTQIKDALQSLMTMPSWLDQANQQTQRDISAYQRGGVPALMADTGTTQDLAGGFGGITKNVGIRAYHGSPAVDAEIRSRLANLPVGSIDEAIAPRADHFYRFLTGSEYQDALKTGMLSPGPNSGGLLNFSEKPIAVYGASAWRDPGMLAEVPRANIAKYPSANFMPGSKDSAAFTREPIPLSDASRVFGYQWPGNGMHATDITSLLFKPEGIRAYHGSPYDFDKFDLSKIGTGEGAQAYGHGLYFAENPAVAREYRKNLSPYQWSDASEINKLLPAKYQGSNDASRRIIDDVLNFKGEPKDYLNEFEVQKDLIPAYQKAMETVGSKGKMYEVNINAGPEQFLDWDKPLSQQPQTLQEWAKTQPARIVGNDMLRGHLAEPTGESVYRRIGYGNQATEQLREAGIPGIKYLDQGSRNLPPLSPNIGGSAGLRITAKENPTSNYVVFNPDLIDIRNKWMIPGAAGPLGMLMAPQGDTQQ